MFFYFAFYEGHFCHLRCFVVSLLRSQASLFFGVFRYYYVVLVGNLCSTIIFHQLRLLLVAFLYSGVGKL